MPPDTNHPALLTDFVEGLIPLLELCNIHALDPQQLAAWATSDQTQRDLAALAHLAQLRAAAVAAQAHPTALARLAAIALTPTAPNTDPHAHADADTTGPRAIALAAKAAANPKALSLRARLTETTRKAATFLAASPNQSRERKLATSPPPNASPPQPATPTANATHPTNDPSTATERARPRIEPPHGTTQGAGPTTERARLSIERAGLSIEGAGLSIEGAGLSSPARTRPPLQINQHPSAVTNHAPPKHPFHTHQRREQEPSNEPTGANNPGSPPHRQRPAPQRPGAPPLLARLHQPQTCPKSPLFPA